SNPCTQDICDGSNNGCQHPAGNPGATCRNPSCTPGTPAQAIPTEVCTGNSTVCPGPNPQSCPSNLCNGNVCSGGCNNDGDCTSDKFCLSSVCTLKRAKGGACQADNYCQSGLTCVDNVCCTGACAGGTGDCQACNNPGKLGDCLPRPANTLCRAANGECDA